LDILRSAVTDSAEFLDFQRVSSVYRTAPQDYADQGDFLNLAVEGMYAGSPAELLVDVHALEAKYGRDRGPSAIPKGPRTLDVDILLFGERQVQTKDLTVPHPRMRERLFALIPLLELLPDCADPVTGESYGSIAAALPDQGVKKAGDLYGT
jgi:2-amino-4-hydroxy-6-hydroxymethyldihydropteridine diphosphokinase